MKFLLTTVLLSGFVSVAVFGLAGAGHGARDAHGSDCIMAIAKGTDCPKQKSQADYLAFHLNTFKSFSAVTFGEPIAASLLSILLLAFGMGLRTLFGMTPPPELFSVYVRRRWRRFLDSLPKSRLLCFLALQEHSPTPL